ncbi:hypothetical protein CS387_01100 [Porphyromonas gingivalis]|nr:hypothetical protein CS387_01100 [Porphyromonas gingivalis]
MQIIRYFFKHNAHVLWAFTINQKTNPLAFSYVELTLIQVEREISNSEGETRIDRQYYISSLPPEDCQLIGQYIRGHWGIENRLHWHLDVTFREDTCRARKDYSATNLNTLRKFALAIVSGHKDKLSLRKRLFKAALNMDYLKKLLKI